MRVQSAIGRHFRPPTAHFSKSETVSGALHGLAETNEPSHAGANSGRPTPTASGSLARRRCYRREDPDGRRTVAGYKRRPCTDGCRRRTVQFQQSSGRGSAQRRQGERESSGSQSVDQGEHPVPNVEEEQAAAATLRRWQGHSSLASRLRRKGEGKCHGTIEARSSAVQRGI